MSRPPASPEQVARTREALLDVAQRLYEAGGLEGMSFRAIATEYGCSYSMPYSYFDSKADLVDGLRFRVYDWLHDLLAKAAAGADDPTDALEAIAETYVEAGLSRPRFYELLYSDAGALPEDDPAFVRVKLRSLNVCRDAIVAAAEHDGRTLTTDPDTAASLFWVAAHGLVSLQVGGFLVVGRTGEDILPRLFTTMTRGLIEPSD